MTIDEIKNKINITKENILNETNNIKSIEKSTYSLRYGIATFSQMKDLNTSSTPG